MDRDERESLHVAMIFVALFAFLGGLALGATVVENLKAKVERMTRSDLSVEP